MSRNSTIYLLGDAILDNFYNLNKKDLDLRKELSNLGYNVVNCAVDDVKVVDIINGIKPRDIYLKSRSYPYPIEKDGKMYPIKFVLSNTGGHKSFASYYDGFNPQITYENYKLDDMVVISMGGNDIESKSSNAILGAESFMNAVITKQFIANYKHVIEMVHKNCSKIVLVSVYLPYLGNGSKYGMYGFLAKPVMEKWNKFITEIAKEYNIPVLDLSRTLDISNREHYGLNDSRVSNIANKCMADCLAYISSHFDGYHSYYATGCDITNLVVE